MRYLLGLLATVAVATALLTPTLLAPPEAQAGKGCGILQVGSSKAKVGVFRGRIACSSARRIVKRNYFGRGRMVRGWFCYTAKGQGRLAGVCAPPGTDPDVARRVIRVYTTG